MSQIQSINPHDNSERKSYELFDNSTIKKKISLANEAYKKWSKTSFEERKKLFLALADTIESQKDDLAMMQTLEMGMVISQSKKGLDNTIHLIRWFANNAESILQNEIFERDGEKGEFVYDSLGVIFGIAPWNFPFNQVLRAAVPNILAGNTQVYKHASNVPECAETIEKLFLEAGFPEGVYVNMFVSSSKSELILSDDRVRGVNLTGSEGAGSAVGSLAGKYLKPSVLELGGNDAFIVAHNDRIQEITKEAMKARLVNNGEKCNSSKRFIVLSEYYDDFVRYAKAYLESVKIGDPSEEDTDLGPLARPDLRDEVHEQVQKTISEGARLVYGGEKIVGEGNYYMPTLLSDVTKEMTSYKEEVFGPVASVIEVSSIEEAIEVANDSDFGLCGCVYGDDDEELRKIARAVQTGMMFINTPAGSRASLPFGGIKKSGYGKENGPDGLKAFVNKKVVLY